MNPFIMPTPAAEHVVQLGQHIRIARLRRRWTVAELAQKAGINRNTLTALELGKPGTSLGTYVTVLWVLGLDSTLEAIAHPDSDLHGKALEAARRLRRAGKPRKTDESYDF